MFLFAIFVRYFFMLRQLTHFEVTLLIPSQNCVVCICHIFEDAKKRFDILFDGFGFKGARGGGIWIICCYEMGICSII